MAIGTLTPSLRVCFTEKCKTLKIYDTTKEYNATSNTGGWGATNILTTAVTDASVKMTDPDGNETTYDVTSDITAETTVTDEFLIAQETITGTDGEYTFDYTITDGVGTVTYCRVIYNTCSVRCCVDELWAKAAAQLEDTSCCDKTTTTYEDKAMKAEALYMAIRNAASSVSDATRDALLKKLQRICNLENCNCN